MPPPDERTDAVAAAARAFLDTLAPDRRADAVFPFDDDARRANWSDIPDGASEPAGVARGDMTGDRLAALDALRAEARSERGLRDARLRMAADDVSGTLDPSDATSTRRSPPAGRPRRWSARRAGR